MHMPHRWPPYRLAPGDRGSRLPSARVNHSLVTDDTEGWPSRPDHPSFPGGDRAMDPPGHTARYWQSRISTDQPRGSNGKEVSTREHLFTPCPGRPHKNTPWPANWFRPGVPAPGATDGRRAPASGGTFTSTGLSSWAARSSRAFREGIIPGGTSWFHPLPASRGPTMSLWTTLATGTVIRDSTSGHPTVLSEFSLNSVDSRESPDTPNVPGPDLFLHGDEPLFCSKWLSHTRQRSTNSRIGVSGRTLSRWHRSPQLRWSAINLSRTIRFRAQVPISPNPRTAKISNSMANVAGSAPNVILNTSNLPGE